MAMGNINFFKIITIAKLLQNYYCYSCHFLTIKVALTEETDQNMS